MSEKNQHTPIPARTPRTRNRRIHPPEAELPNIEPAANTTYGSGIPALPDQAETGANIQYRSIAQNLAEMPPKKSAARNANLRTESVVSGGTRASRRVAGRSPSLVSEVESVATRRTGVTYTEQTRSRHPTMSPSPPSRTFGDESAAGPETPRINVRTPPRVPGSDHFTEISSPSVFLMPQVIQEHTIIHDTDDQEERQMRAASTLSESEPKVLFKGILQLLGKIFGIVAAIAFVSFACWSMYNQGRASLPAVFKNPLSIFGLGPAPESYGNGPTWSASDCMTSNGNVEELVAKAENKMKNMMGTYDKMVEDTKFEAYEAFFGGLEIKLKDLFNAHIKQVELDYGLAKGNHPDVWSKFFHMHEHSIAALIREEVRKYFENRAHDVDIAAVVSAGLEHVNQFGLDRINWFSPGLSAKIESVTTSPTWFQKFPALRRLASYFVDIGYRPSRPPEEVLYSWEEPNDRWCSTNMTDDQYLGNVQFAVKLPHEVYPTDVTIEHYPASALPDVRAAPKDMEVWVRVLDMSQHIAVKQVSDVTLGPTPPRGRKLPVTYLRVASFRYDPYQGGHVQNFPIPLDLTKMRIPVNRVLIRATTNWGADYTCFYRARLGGTLVDASRIDPKNRQKGFNISNLFGKSEA